MREIVGPDILDTPAAGGVAIRGGITRVLGYGAGVALSVLSAALLIRHLGPSDFGRYTAVISLATILGAVAEGGMTTIGVREYSVLRAGERERFLGELNGLRLATTATGVVLAVLFAAVAGYDGVMVAGCAIVGLGLLLQGAQFNYQIPLQSRLRLGWVTTVELVRQAATVAGIVVLVAAGASLLPFFWVTLVAAVVTLLFTFPLVRGLVPFRPSFHVRHWRRLLLLTVPFGAANALGAVYVYLAVVVLSVISTESETGYFGASFRIFLVLGAVAGLLVASAFPILSRAARDDSARLAYAIQRLWEILLLLGTGVAMCTAVGAELAIAVVAGAEFDPSVVVLQIQSLALLATYVLAVWSFALLSLGSYRGILVANAVALIVSLGFTVVLGWKYGADGAAVATVCGEAALATGYGFALFRRHRDLRPSLEILPRVGAAALAAAAVLLIPGLPDTVRLPVVATVYMAAAYLFGAIPDEVIEALRARRADRGSNVSGRGRH